MRLAYADPPYPGKAHLYADHPDYAGEVDHAALIASLEQYDGWALSTWEPALAELLPLCPPGTRILAWCRTNEPPFVRGHDFPSRSWEPVLCQPARKLQAYVRSYLQAGAPTGFLQKDGLTGQKPTSFCRWVIHCLGADRDDSLEDLFPGTGIMGQTWEAWRNQLELELVQPRTFRPQHRANQIRSAHAEQIA